MKKIASLSALCGVGLLFTACGDDVTEIHNTSGVESYATIKELPDCTAENAGELAFVSDSAKVYYCADSSWQALNGKDGKDGANGEKGASGESCTAAALADKSGYTIICGADTVGVVKNGENGLNGSDGDDGTNGSAGAGCTATPLADDSGYKIVCGGDSVGVVLNGSDGAQGIQGEKGEKGDPGEKGEKGDKGEDGSTYEPLCSGVAYDPATQFCRHDEVYDLCGEQPYEPLTHFCAADGKAYEKCGGADYAPADEFCQDGAVYPRCGSDKVTYDGHAFKCEGNALFSRCAVAFDRDTEICYDGAIMRTCGEMLYDKDLYECVDGAVTNPACGDKTYDKAAGEECRDNVVYAVCGEGFYNKESQRCENGKAVDIFVDRRDNQVYRVTTIGTQTWMAENLNYAGVTSWCYDDAIDNCEIYGRLYQWDVAVTVCPTGWHLPSDEEWQTLNDFVQAEKGENVGNYLRASTGWKGEYEDPYGFAALPAGSLDGNSGSFYSIGIFAPFCSATEDGAYTYYWGMADDNSTPGVFFRSSRTIKRIARPVRCLKDSD